jgi:hypothetical protein
MSTASSVGEEPVPDSVPPQLVLQIAALRVLMALTERAQLAFAVSEEVIRQAHGTYLLDVADHWQLA